MPFGTTVAASLGLFCAALGTPVTTGSLLDEMIDMHRLTRFPEPTFKNIQFSSYDRSSDVPGGKGWFANSDGFGGEPVPNFEAVLKAPEGDAPGEYLMCDVDGPGAIVRVWTAKIDGRVRVYLDGAETPVYEGDAEDFFKHPYDAYLGGTDLTPELLSGTLYQSFAAYAPMPFAKHCRIVWVGNHEQTHFYAIQIRKYETGTEVVTFTPADLKTYAPVVRRVASVFADVDAKWPYRSTEQARPFSVTVEPHALVEGLKLEGAGAIERLELRVEAANLDEALRRTVLHVQCDGAPWGQVQSPVGDYFGAGPGVNPYTSAASSVSPGGTMTSRYVIPYKESARILFDNRSDTPVKISGTVLRSDYAWDERSMYFYARWRVNHGLVASGEDTMGAQDLPFLLARGQGLYVGTAIMLLNPNNVPTPHGNWWGEGDEKIFVDDDRQPSIFGTGSEDYFNYAWSSYDLFSFPYCGQPRNDGPANRGFVVNYRWHVLDPIPFKNNIAFYMELFSHERTEGFSYARLSYCYGREGLTDDHVALTDENLRIPEFPKSWEPAARFGVDGFTFFACEDLAASGSPVTFEEGPMWQGGKAMVWTPAQAGDALRLAFTVPQDGQYDLTLAAMLRKDGGAARIEVDGRPIRLGGRETFEFTAPFRTLSRLEGARAGQLTAGKHELSFFAVEAGKPIGLDFLGYRAHE
jgi:hypothetical protein